MAVDRERRMVRHCRFETKPAEPPVGEVEPDLVTQSPLGTDRVAVADQQHPDHQLRIYRRAADLAVERPELLTDPVEVEQRIQPTQQMVRRNLVLEPEMVEQPLLTRFQPPHHRQNPSRSIPPRQNHGSGKPATRLFQQLQPKTRHPIRRAKTGIGSRCRYSHLRAASSHGDFPLVYKWTKPSQQVQYFKQKSLRSSTTSRIFS